MGLRDAIAKRFIPTRHPSWQEYATASGGTFVSGGALRTDEVVTRSGPWEVHVDSVMLDPRSGIPKPGTFYSSRRGTRAWANFSSTDGFRFAMRARSWAYQHPWGLAWDIDPGRLVDAIKGKLGVEDVTVGDQAFDERYTVRTNDPAKLRRLMTEGGLLGRLASRSLLEEVKIEAAPPTGDGSAQPATLLMWERELLLDSGELMDLQRTTVMLLEGLAAAGSAAPPVEARPTS